MCFVIGTLALIVLHGSLRVALTASIATTCMALSLVVLTGYVGQVSLAQMSFAGVGAFTLTHIASSHGVPFLVSLIGAALVAIPLGLLIGLPALRLRGVNLAVVTLAAAFALDALVFNNDDFSGGLAGREVPSPTLFGWDVGIAHGNDYPRIVFGVVALLIVCIVGVGVARLRNGPAGRMFIAVRSNERAAAAIGIDVARTKLMAFALSAFIAGIGGGLLAYQQQTVSAPSFATFASLGLLAVTYVAGVGRIAGAVVAGVMLSSTGLFVTAMDKAFGVGKYQLLVAGVALTITAIKQPDGIAATPPPPLVKLWHMISSRWDRRNGSSAGAAKSAPAAPPAPPVRPAVKS
jgi:ABC-type branched-subunit amino acid transport system permease subunit